MDSKSITSLELRNSKTNISKQKALLFRRVQSRDGSLHSRYSEVVEMLFTELYCFFHGVEYHLPLFFPPRLNQFQRFLK